VAGTIPFWSARASIVIQTVFVSGVSAQIDEYKILQSNFTKGILTSKKRGRGMQVYTVTANAAKDKRPGPINFVF